MNSNFITFALNIISEFSEKYDLEKERIKKEYKETYLMPRKLKKRKRKELSLDWELNEYTKCFTL